MQVFRLVCQGIPDKVIAFDQLPERMLNGVTRGDPTGLPRAWKAILGEGTRITPGIKERDPFTHTVTEIPAIVEKGPFFYVLDYMELNADKEKWAEISAFVRKVVDPKFRLPEKLEDFALPMAASPNSELTLEPEDVDEKACVTIPEEFQEKGVEAALPKNAVQDVVYERLKHGDKCTSKGRGGMLTPACPRCDQLKAEKLAAVA